jgi:hypothetical protein
MAELRAVCVCLADNDAQAAAIMAKYGIAPHGVVSIASVSPVQRQRSAVHEPDEPHESHEPVVVCQSTAAASHKRSTPDQVSQFQLFIICF